MSTAAPTINPDGSCATCPPDPIDATSSTADNAGQPGGAQATSSSAQVSETQVPASQPELPILPPVPVYPIVTIEFCDRCRWAPRATWIQTELFLTFPTPVIRAITLIPLTSPETGGRFRVWLDKGIGGVAELVWDRKTEGGFPELKLLKQRLRNIVSPDMGLGHSDKPGTPVISH